MNRRDLLTIGPAAALTGQAEEQPRQSSFEGWAVVQIMGYQQEAGYVTTEYFGATAMFRITVPAMAARKQVEHLGEYRYPASPERFRLISPLAVHSLHPCSRDEALVAIEGSRPKVYAPTFAQRPDDDEVPF